MSTSPSGASGPAVSRAGGALSWVAGLFLGFDGAIKLLVIQPVVEAFTQLGVPVPLAAVIGGLELALVALYLVPATAVLGTVLLTGFLGGATILHLRLAAPLLSHVLFPTYIGLLLWGGLLRREPRLRALFPVRTHV